MSFTHSIVVNYTADGAARSSISVQATGSAQASINESIADSTTDGEIEVSFPYANLTALIINSTQDVTLETNSGSAADDTLNLTANTPVLWYTGCGYTCPITADVTSIFITNASGAAATITADFLWDATP